VGAAEFDPPASGRIALFSIATEFDVFSLALPVIAADDVVQLVSAFSGDGAAVCANATPATIEPAKIPAAMRAIILISRERKKSPSQIQGAERPALMMVPLVGIFRPTGSRKSGFERH
jgi:hypothetical protein